jgi:CRP-like cAMP-binding protein
LSVLKGDKTNIINVYRDSPLFINLDEDGLAELANLSILRHFAKGDPIFLESDPADFLYFVADGRVKIFKSSSSGKIFTLMVAVRGDPTISVNPFKENTRIFSSVALDNVTAIRVDRIKFVSFVQEHPSIAIEIIEIFVQLLDSAHERIIDLIGEPVEQRLINVLHMLSSKFGAELHFTSEELADLSGTTTETAIRILSRLKHACIISSGRGKLFILDESKLRDLSRRMFII